MEQRDPQNVGARLYELQEKIGIAFRDPSLLHEALTHSSYANENPEASPRDNERLEYLGDAVLQLISAEYLYKRRPEAREGEMTQVRSAMVNTNALASLAEELGLGNYLFLGKGIAKGGGRGLRSLLANSFEAVLGAIFLDAGYDAAYHYCLERFQGLPDGVQDENHKGRLQQLVQERYGVTPFYDSIGARGQGGRSREYTAVVYAAGDPLGTGYGRSKQTAEQGAAKDAIEKLVGDTPARSRAARRGRRRGRGEEGGGSGTSEDPTGAWPVEAERGPARPGPVAVESLLHSPLPPGDGAAEPIRAGAAGPAVDEPGGPEPRRRRSRRPRSREGATAPEAAAPQEAPTGAEAAGAAVDEPSASEPGASEPSPSEPSASEPSPSEPSPSELSPSEPSPSEPRPSEPSPSEPSPSEPRRRRSRRSRSREASTVPEAVPPEEAPEVEPPRPRQFGEPVPAPPQAAEALADQRPQSRQGGRGRRRPQPPAEVVPVLEPAELPESQTSPRWQSEPGPSPPRQFGEPVAVEAPPAEPPRTPARRSRSRRASSETAPSEVPAAEHADAPTTRAPRRRRAPSPGTTSAGADQPAEEAPEGEASPAPRRRSSTRTRRTTGGD